MSGATPRRLWNFVTRRLRLRGYFEDPGDGRRQPQIPARALLWALVLGQLLRQWSFHAVEALACSSARVGLRIPVRFGGRHAALFCGAPGCPPLAAGTGAGGSPRQAKQSLRCLRLDRSGGRRHRCRMANPPRLHPVSAKAERRATDPRLSTSFRHDQRGGDRTVFALRWRALRARR